MTMAVRLTPAQREEYGAKAWTMSLRGKSAPAIGRELAISEKTVDGLLKRERQRMASEYADQRLAHQMQFIGEQRAVLSDCWDRLYRGSTDQRSVPGIQANALTASLNIAKARGLLVERHEMSGSVDLVTRLEQLWKRPLPEEGSAET